MAVMIYFCQSYSRIDTYNIVWDYEDFNTNVVKHSLSSAEFSVPAVSDCLISKVKENPYD